MPAAHRCLTLRCAQSSASVGARWHPPPSFSFIWLYCGQMGLVLGDFLLGFLGRERRRKPENRDILSDFSESRLRLQTLPHKLGYEVYLL